MSLDKNVKYEKRACIELVKGKLAKNTSMDPVLFLVLQPKNNHLYSWAVVDMSKPAKKSTLAQAYKRIFRLEKRKYRNDHSAMHM